MIDNRTAPYAALFLRLSLSFLFFAHIYRKFAMPNSPEPSCSCWVSTQGM